MKGVRPLLLGTVVAAVLLLLAAGVVFSTSFQTWAARRLLASRPGWGVTVDSVSAGLQRIEALNVSVRRVGAVLHLPRVEADVPLVSSAWKGRPGVTRLEAKGWTLDLSKTAAGPAGAVAPAEAAVRAFAGVLPSLGLPLDFSIDAVALEGEVILPEARGRVRVTIGGGGLGAGREARFELVADADLRDEDVAAIRLRSEIAATMDAAGRAARVAATLEGEAVGRRFPQGAKVRGELAAVRSPAGESYVASMVADGREVLKVAAEFGRDAQRLEGGWKLNLRDQDLVPLAMGRPLPVLAVAGEGRIESDAGLEEVRWAGRLSASAGRLETLRPGLAALGEVHLEADFDFSERRGIIGVRKLESAIRAARPVATIRGLQAFEFNPRTGDVRAADATREFLGVALQGLPLTWAGTLLRGLEISGGDLRGEWVVAPRADGGIALRSVSPAQVERLDLAQGGRRLAEQVDLRLRVSGDHSPQGWQVEVNGEAASHGASQLLTLETRAGQLAGTNQAVKATGTLSANLPVLLNQPLAAGWASLTSGYAKAGFAASWQGGLEMQANVSLGNLEVAGDGTRPGLPAVALELRADVGADGAITFHVPVTIGQGERTSDLTVSGTVDSGQRGIRTIDVQARGTRLMWDDGRPLAAALVSGLAAREPLPLAPFWEGWRGKIRLQMKELVGAAGLSAHDVTGLVRVDAGGVRLEEGQAGLGESGRASAGGQITFESPSLKPYALVGELTLKDLDLGAPGRESEGSEQRIVQGRFDVTGRLTARAQRLSDLMAEWGGRFHVSSRGGLFRGLPVTVTQTADPAGRLAGLFASAGSMLGGLTGRKEEPAIANRTEALAELVRALYPITYDQLAVTLTRDAADRTVVQDFTLIAPELRITGGGLARHRPGGPLLEDSLLLEFQLRARGRQGEILKYLGVLDASPDDLGYRACTMPLSVAGTVGQPDAAAVNQRLAALAVDKGGLTEKATELFNRIRGGGK